MVNPPTKKITDKPTDSTSQMKPSSSSSGAIFGTRGRVDRYLIQYTGSLVPSRELEDKGLTLNFLLLLLLLFNYICWTDATWSQISIPNYSVIVLWTQQFPMSSPKMSPYILAESVTQSKIVMFIHWKGLLILTYLNHVYLPKTHPVIPKLRGLMSRFAERCLFFFIRELGRI